ncbi:cytidine deaminase, partial [Malassezia equina]
RSAICRKMTDADVRAKQIVAVAVSSDSEAPCTPCGICRQVVREFCTPHTPIFMPHKQWTANADRPEHVLVCTLEQLLPHSFGPDMMHREGSGAYDLYDT